MSSSCQNWGVGHKAWFLARWIRPAIKHAQDVLFWWVRPGVSVLFHAGFLWGPGFVLTSYVAFVTGSSFCCFGCVLFSKIKLFGLGFFSQLFGILFFLFLTYQ